MGHGSVSFILVGDTHTSSRYGICTPRPEKGDGSTWYANKFQKKLYDGYLKMCDQIENKDRIQALITTGDLLDGPNLHKAGKDQWTMDPIDAAYDISKILLPLAQKAKMVRCIRGSNYHVSPGPTTVNYDELVAQLLGATPSKPELMSPAETIKLLAMNGKSPYEIREMVKSGKLEKLRKPRKSDNPLMKKLQKEDNIFKRDILSRKQNNGEMMPYPRSDVKFKGIYNGVGIVVRHNGSYSANYMYRGTGPTRNDVIMTLQKERHFPDGYNYIVNLYGHAHYYHITGNATHYNVVCPCWKGNDEFLQEKGNTEPDYGIVEVVVEPNGRVLIYPHVLGGADYPTEPPVDLNN